MEPLAAVALAGNVLQFAEFVGRLFKDTSKIYASASGLTPNDLHIQDICVKLGTFSAQLQSVPSHSSAPPDLRDCVAACKKDCDDLLAIMKGLAAKKGNSQRPWKSFSAALCHRMKAGEIQDLRSRVTDRQHLMSLMLSDMLNEGVRAMSNELSQLQSTITDWTTRTTTWFQMLQDTQKSLSQQVQTLIRRESIPQNAIESICSGLKGLSIDARECQQTMNILNSLDYEERPKRHSNIPEAHAATFSWGLQQDKPGESQGSSGSFRRWLSGDSKLFWVSGKPGSGKSTFMKFVAGNKKTKECLEKWAGHGELVLARHFFTIYGTTIQRSLEGLLRSLLHNILEGEPKLIPKLLPTRWTNTSKQSQWTQSDLESALRAVAKMDLSVHMCFFIDGLDEYSGDHLEICQTLKELSEPPSIKICVSSRPWNVFEDAFGNSRESKLYMHELTHEDILNYTQARLSEHPRWSFVSSGPDAAASKSLINEVVDRSMGVFLWVFLVTRLLREGLSNDDKFSDLKRRVSSCPDDLEDFFKHILASVDSFYHEKMAGTLMVARDAEEPLDVEMFVFLDQEYDDENYALHPPAYHAWLDDDNYLAASSSIARRINGRCKGLLEWQNYKMDFLHRTVFDFLRTPEMVRFLQEKARANFSSHLSLLRARIAWFKRTAFHQNYPGEEGLDVIEDVPGFVHGLREAARYACLASDEGGDIEVAVSALLDNAELGIAKMVRTNQIPAQYESMAVGVYRLLLLESGIEGYVHRKLSIPGYLDSPYTERHHSPLSFALNMAPGSSPSASSIRSKTTRRLLERLLKLRYDPNEVYGNVTFWARFLWDYAGNAYSRFPAPMLHIVLEAGILETLLRHGADPTTYVSCIANGYKIPFWLHLVLVGPHIEWNHQLAFEKVWILTLERTPALSQAKVLKKVDSQSPWVERESWTTHCLWDVPLSEILVQGFRGQPQPENRFFLGLLENVLDRVRDSPTTFERYQTWFAQYICVDPHELMQRLPSGLQEMSFRKRLAGEDEEGGSRTTKARRLV
ncbi:hypothetical protein B0J15DRAFT_489585 [Fusarium solani]|uniref:NACHT domain-containing protein n=1 Tax=Fusarium solani TaxID=169388 RepID=A0A9P9HUP4_FUSSL|nr:uncharacterized protein B0J15DRAFT_489585 [Fusarium solani]KAH7263965.1 hypothetical protein B0J15DRAFT_489585 [Fusarium solani]